MHNGSRVERPQKTLCVTPLGMLIPMTVEVPPYQYFLWPALQAVIALGGSASIAELDAAVIDRENISPKWQSVLHGDGPMTEVLSCVLFFRRRSDGTN